MSKRETIEDRMLREAEVAAARLASKRSEYPKWDDAHAATLASSSSVSVDYEPTLSADGLYVNLVRTVWSVAYRKTDQHVLWTGAVASFPLPQVGQLVRDVVELLARAAEPTS